MNFSVFFSVLIEIATIFTLSTISFDVIHYLLHRFARSESKLLRKLGNFHEVHHQWLGPSLKYDDTVMVQNLLHHRIPEYLNQMVISLAFLAIFKPISILIVCLFQTGTLIAVIAMRGRDSNHKEYDQVPYPRGMLFVGPVYHALHHMHPNHFMGSFVQVFDWIAGTSCPLKDQKVVITGASGAYGKGMKELLEKEGALVTTLKFGQDYQYTDYSGAHAALQSADILILAHGAKKDQAQAANCDSFVALIEEFKRTGLNRRVPRQVWAVGSEIECHPSWGNEDLLIYSRSKRAFAKHAQTYYRDEKLLYRHIVPSAFTSPMGPGLISGKTAAWITLFFIKRGFRYVPVTYTGIAFLNFFKFL